MRRTRIENGEYTNYLHVPVPVHVANQSEK